MPTDDFAWTSFLDAFLQVQRFQWELLGAWQRSILAVQNELFDEWACRWAGGVPIDA